ALRNEKIRYVTVKESGNGIDVRFKDAESRDRAEKLLSGEFRELGISVRDEGEDFFVRVFMTPEEERSSRRLALEQNITTLRNRVNALGVAEPVIQQQGDRRIVVELPGVQDPGKVKDLLGATATLEYRLALSDPAQAFEAESTGRVPAGAALYHERNGQPILLKRQVIVTGDEMTSASSGFDQQSGQPAVYVNLDSKGARRMRNVTSDNVGKPMAVVFKEKRTVGRDAEGKPIRKWVEEVINVATIREPFGRRFQTTGLDSAQEAHQLALLLRAGALAAPIDIVEERTIGPSLGQDNIDQGFLSVMVGMGLVLVFMAVYYKTFGLIANLALVSNLFLIVAILSMLQATLTLPGIAGIVLTVGMAVDANVLIFERIREELRVGSTPQASIHAGYAKAFSTILDANVTTLIAAVVLFSIGSGPVRGFAVTLAIGILTSMFTSIIGTRAVVNLVYGAKPVQKLSI
ncbi:MAG: protein translocase subunit SecD, partial [Sedimenticolaceae bacterium]